MAKQRNTVAKRQREAAKRQQADDKRRRRAANKTNVKEVGESQVGESQVGESQVGESQDTEAGLSSAELAVLSVFRKYLMTPGEMLCCGSLDTRASDATLDQLTRKGLLVQERFRSGYALTDAGFAAMPAAKALELANSKRLTSASNRAPPGNVSLARKAGRRSRLRQCLAACLDEVPTGGATIKACTSSGVSSVPSGASPAASGAEFRLMISGGFRYPVHRSRSGPIHRLQRLGHETRLLDAPRPVRGRPWNRQLPMSPRRGRVD